MPVKKIILKEKPDLLFLDIELPDTDGLSLLDEISGSVDWNMQVVFFTAHSNYMLQAIRKSVFDYLLKPIEKEDLAKIINRFCEETAKEPEQVQPSFSDLLYRFMPDNHMLLFTSNSTKQVIRVNDIGFFTYHSAEKQWVAQQINGTSVSIKKNTNAKEIIDCSPYFIQTHQSFIINLNYLQEIKGNKCYLLPPFDKHIEIPISKSEKKNLEDKMIQL